MSSMIANASRARIGPMAKVQVAWVRPRANARRRRAFPPPERRSRPRAAEAAASSAGLALRGRRRLTRQRAPEKARLATVAKPASSVRSASNR
jgi:hypothetical protein